MSHRPECPRCGYDQSGVITTWARAEPSACPLTGVCSECGLAFAWRDVLVPGRAGPAWCWERGERPSLRRFVSTAARTLWSGRFWGAMPLALPIRYGRLAVMAALPVALYHLACVGLVVWDETQHAGWFGISRPAWAYAWPYGQPIVFGIDETYVPMLFWWWLLPVVAMTLAMLALGASFRLARVRRAHLARAAAYAMPMAMTQAAVASVVIMVGYWLSYSSRLGFWVPEWEWQVIGMGLWLVWFAWLVRWWVRMVGAYLRLGRSGLIVTLIATIGLLTTLTGYAVFQMGPFSELLRWTV